MKASTIEHILIVDLADCRFQAGSFDKKFVRELDVNNISPLQQWWIYYLGFKYRKQIGDPRKERICKLYLDNNQKPLSRKESEKILRKAKKEKKELPPPMQQTKLF